MKTKIIMMSALLALAATGCTKDDNQKVNDGRIKIFAENMTAASNGSKVLIDPTAPVNGEQWIAGEYIKVNNSSLIISGDDEGGYSVSSETVALVNGALYAVYPGQGFNNNDVTVDNSDPTHPSITLNKLSIDFASTGNSHKVVFPMGAKADGETTSILFKHLTAGFQLTLRPNAEVTLTNLKVIVYGAGAASAITDVVDGVSYTVAWKGQGPAVPVGDVGSITDRDVSYASEMNFDLRTNGTLGVTFDSDKKLCIPVTLANVRRITVIGYNGSEQIFATTSAISAPYPALECNKIYPVKAIEFNVN